MPEPISSASYRYTSWPDPSDEDDFRSSSDVPEEDAYEIGNDPQTLFTSSGDLAVGGSNAVSSGVVLQPIPGQLQYLPPAIAKLLQPTFDRLAETNGGRRLDIGAVPFVVKDLGGAKGQTVRGVISISPAELTRPLEKQLYVIGHELTHVLQFEVIGPPGADADTRWSLMSDRYASDEKQFGKESQYKVPADLILARLNVLDPRFALESIARRVGEDAQGRLFDR